MKLRYILISLLSGLLFTINSSLDATNNPCLCYCSYKPGPRKAKSDDTPCIINTKKLQPNSDKVYDICFCKQRDIDKFAKDPSVVEKVTQKDLDQLTCCDDEAILWLM